MAFDILIVDDSATTRAVIKRTIQLAQVPIGNLYQAASGKAALEVVAQHKVDLVLADLHMPEMGGLEMTFELRANPATAGIPVVVVSAEPNQDNLEQLRGVGVKSFIRKPFTPEQVREAICQTLGVAHV